MTMKRLLSASTVALAAAAPAWTEDLTLCWAAWEPADALAELSKEFEAQSGHDVSFELVPWPDFADRMQSEMTERGQLCDLLIGESQWIGGGAKNGHYVKLNDFLEAEAINMADFLPASVEAYATWPKGTQNYYALPAMGDAIGWVYRKDWFENQDIKAAYTEATGDVLDVPQSQTELLQIAKFFQEREIEGQSVHGAAIFIERGSDGITLGATSALYPWGVTFEPASDDINVALNTSAAVEALEFYKDLYQSATPPVYGDGYVGASLDALRSGQVAMAMNWFSFFPALYADQVIGNKIDTFANPPQTTAGSALGGQGISVVAYSDKQDAALAYLKWFAAPEVQAKWWDAGGFSTHMAVLDDPDYSDSRPFADAFRTAMDAGQGFWLEPYAELLLAMQERFHDYIVSDQGTAQHALDKLVEDWTQTSEENEKF